MKIKLVTLLAFSIALSTLTGKAEITISDFSNLAGENPVFSGSWNNGTPQFTQQSGFISIEPVNGGNPSESGDFAVTLSSPLNLTSQPNIALTARFDLNNADTTISVGFTDGNLNTVSAIFAGFTSSFSTIQVARNSFTGDFDWSNVSDYAIGGGNPAGSATVRWSVDSLTAVPEPSTYALMALGGLVLLFMARRRKAQG